MKPVAAFSRVTQSVEQALEIAGGVVELYECR